MAPDCLRSAVNSFYYQPPATLPPRSPASSLASEPHSFSRVFTSGVLRVLNGVFATQPHQDADALGKAAEDTGRLLVEGVRRAAVGARILRAGSCGHGGNGRGTLRRPIPQSHPRRLPGGRGIVGAIGGPTSSSRLDATTDARLAPDAADPDAVDGTALVLPLSAYGLPSDLLVRGAAEPRRFGVASGLADTGEASAPAPEQAAASFVEDLLRRGQVDASRADGGVPIVARGLTTHEIVPTDNGLELRRTRFDCGFHIGEAATQLRT